MSHLLAHQWLNSSIWPIDWTLTGITNLDQSEPGNNVNEGVLHIPQSFRTGNSLSNTIQCHIQNTCFGVGTYLSAEMLLAYSTVATN